MKAPSRNISRSLSGQSQGGPGEAETATVTGLKKSQSGIVPGESSVQQPPGKRHERSAAAYHADASGRVK